MPKEKDFDWFPLYPRRLLLSRKASKMSPSEFGIYVKLLCHEWIDLILPDDQEELAEIAGAEIKEFKSAWSRVSKCFTRVDGGLVNEVLEEIRQEQIAKHKDAVRRGYLGSEARYGKGEAEV